MMNYQTFRTIAEALERRVQAASAELGAITADIANRLGIPARGPMGLTPDAIKARPEYRAAKQAFDSAFADMRRFNGRHAARFKNETRADIAAKRLATLERNLQNV